MSQQLVKKGANGRMVNVNPKSWIEAIKDKNTGQTLVEILQGFNMYFLPYNGNTSSTRCLVPTVLRKKGLWITYVKYDGNVYTEWYAASEIDDKSWGDNSNWRVGNNTLVGDITISANGNWVINGTETEFKAVGEKGNTPILRVVNNRLQVSYNLGEDYMDITDNPVYTKFRWLATTGDTQANNVGRIQASTDEGKTWTSMSNDFINNLHISRYIGVNESLPTSGIAEGTIYAKGPYYDEGDTLNDNPIYRLWVYAWKGNTLAWQDNGEFTSIAAGVVQEIGDSETEVMSQKAVTEELSELDSYSLDTSLVGDDDNYVQKRLHLVAGRRYRIDVLNPNYSRDSASLDKRIFAIYHNEGSNTVYDYSVSKTGSETVNPFYVIDAIECLNNNRYSILVRADKDVTVNCRVQDITDVEYKAPILVTSANLEVVDSKTISLVTLQISTVSGGYRSIQANGGVPKTFVFNQEDTGLVLVLDKDDKIVFRSGASTIKPTDIVLLAYSVSADKWTYGHLLPLVYRREVNTLELRLFDTPFVGADNTLVSKYARLASNHKYRIDIVNPNWDSSAIGIGNVLFGISHKIDGNRVYDYQIVKEDERKISSSYIINSVVCDNQMYQFSIRGNKGEEVFIRITDITDSEANKQRIDDVVDNIIGGGLYSSVGEPTILSNKIEGLVFGNAGEVYQTINSNYNNHIECPVSKFSSINISTTLNINKNTSLTAFIVVDKNNVVLHREFYKNNEDYRRNIKVSINYNLPTNASKILVQSSISANSNVVIAPVELTTLVEGINKVSSKEDYVSVEGLSVTEGELQENGIIFSGNGKLTTSLLIGKFIINTTDDVIIERVIMCNLNGDILNYDLASPVGPTDIIDWQSLYNAQENKHYFGVYNDMPDIGYKLVLSGKKGKILTRNMNVFTKYLKLDSLKSTVEKNTAMYQVLRRNNQMMRVQWTCQTNIPQTVSDYFKNTFFKNGQSFISLPYSQAEEYAKMLLFDVSLRTFITSLYNPHSLFNTENISMEHSKSRYGFSYNGTNCATYYGNVCSGYTGWLMGLRGKVFTQQIPLIEGVNELEGINAYNIMPSTILLNSHHCMYIQDVLTDDYGNRKIIVLGEMTTPTAKLIPYTPERLQTRLDSESHRYFSYNKWNEIVNENQGWEGDEEFALIDIEQYTNGNYKFNDDICTFAGDYATFGVGDKIYLNVNNKGIYSSVEVYKNNILLTTISLPELVDEDEWVDIDLTGMNLGYGDYKARLTDGINSSDYTYWEVLDTSSRMYRTSGNISADFTAENCTPWSICVCQINGQYYNRETGPLIRNITDEEASEKKVVTTWSHAKSDAYVFIKFRGKYGIALKKVQCSSF